MWDVEQHPWSLPTICQQHLPPSGDNQKCLQTLLSVPGEQNASPFSFPNPLLRTTILKCQLLAGSLCKVCASSLFTYEFKHQASSECRIYKQICLKITYTYDLFIVLEYLKIAQIIKIFASRNITLFLKVQDKKAINTNFILITGNSVQICNSKISFLKPPLVRLSFEFF